MENEFNTLKKSWKDAKSDIKPSIISANEAFIRATKASKNIQIMQFKNSFILLLTLLGLIYFFTAVAHFQDTISVLGMWLMMGSLSLRIIIEFLSIYKSSRVSINVSVHNSNQQYIEFYNYRENIHRKLTIFILIIYSFGFYCLIPEFTAYFGVIIGLLLSLSYVIAFVMFGFFIKKGIAAERTILSSLLQLNEQVIRHNK